MPGHWDVADDVLRVMLQIYVESLSSGDSSGMRLFKNDFEPQPGTNIGDFVEADFPGYVPQMVSATDWGAPVVVAHIATSANETPCIFEASSSGFSSQKIYGYYIVNVDDEYQWSESFAAPVEVTPDFILKVTARLKQATYPNPL